MFLTTMIDQFARIIWSNPMNPRLGSLAARALAIVLSVALLGCAAPAKKAEAPKRVYFPAAPSAPRLLFLTSFSDGKSFGQGPKSDFASWVVGQQKEAATASKLNGPYGIEVRNGKMYICDVQGSAVHVIDIPNKSYKRLEAGERIRNPVHVRIDADDTKYVCDTVTHMVLIFDANDQFVRELGDPEALSPIDLAITKDELFIANVARGKGEVQVWSKDGKHLRTISRKGTGPDELMNPTNLALGPDGNIYVSDSGEQIVKIFNPKGDFLGTLGGPGGQVGQFARNKGIAIDPHGNVYVADSQWDVVQIFDVSHRLLTAFGAPGMEAHSMGLPAGVALDKTSIPYFKSYLDPDFECEYLVFVVNQFKGHDKVTIWAYGRSRKFPASAYQIDYEAARKAVEKLRAERAAKEKAEATSQPVAPQPPR